MSKDESYGGRDTQMKGKSKPQDIIREMNIEFGGSRKGEVDRGLLLK